MSLLIVDDGVCVDANPLEVCQLMAVEYVDDSLMSGNEEDGNGNLVLNVLSKTLILSAFEVFAALRGCSLAATKCRLSL